MKTLLLNICLSAAALTPSDRKVFFPPGGERVIRRGRKTLVFLKKPGKRSLAVILIFIGLFGGGQTSAPSAGSAETADGFEGKEHPTPQASNIHGHRLKTAVLKREARMPVPFSIEKSGQIEIPVQDLLHAPDLKQLQLLIKKGEERAFQKALCEKQLHLKTPPDSCYGFPDLKDRADTHCLNLKIQSADLPSLNRALKNRHLSAICRGRLEFLKKILLYRQKDALLEKSQTP